ncbi:ABC transporter ATP-binding protein [Actinoplanes sp. DH11]|uniref:ABC transporter ATP-binding protein n=1 Tax=Actinoplanes sp. DH11 TaxID=2857011 RepID=UPI001E52BCFD|nr:ABC transporter ATP-binding protein [Actinoplanes sp. DH11]
MREAVTVEKLVKKYHPNMPAALSELDFSVRSGEVFGLLGPNGAGKTTAIGVLTTRIVATSGRATVAGVDVTQDAKTARRVLAVVPQRNNLDRALNVRQNLLYHAAYHGVGRAERGRRADAMLERTGLSDKAAANVDTLSGGQAQRVMIARALMHKPAVLFLDEPTVGLDPQARIFVHDSVWALRDEGVTVVLTTHDMEEAAKLCDRVGIVDHGKLLQLDSPAAMTGLLPGSTTLTVTVQADDDRADAIQAALEDLEKVERVERTGGGAPALPPGMPPPPPWMPAPPAADEDGLQFRLYTSAESSAVVPPMLRALTDIDAQVSGLNVGKPSLEDVFLHLTGRELR